MIRPKTAPRGRRRMSSRAKAFALSVLGLYAAPMAALCAGAPSPLAVTGPWIRSVGGQTPAAAYFTLSNASGKPEVLVGVASPACGELTMHQSRNLNGVETMVAVTQRIVPAHGRIVFAPGGYHLMCMSPSKLLRPGASVPISLRFADGQRLQVRFPVRSLSDSAASR